MKRVLLTGSNGILGTKFLDVARHEYDLVATSGGPCRNAYLGVFYFESLDIVDGDAVRALVRRQQPEIIVHAAAYTDVDRAETDRETCRRVNVDGTRHIVAAAREVGAKVIYLSTDYVFDGTDGPYDETAPPRPLGWYAQTKLDGESAVRDNAGDWLICRTSVLYGDVPHRRKSFADWLLTSLQGGETVSVVDDQFSNPTLAEDLVRMLTTLIDQEKTGIYNTMGRDWVSRHAFATRLAERHGLDPALIRPIRTADLGQPAPRPLRGGGRTDKLSRETGYVPMQLDQQVERYIASTASPSRRKSSA